MRAHSRLNDNGLYEFVMEADLYEFESLQYPWGLEGEPSTVPLIPWIPERFEDSNWPPPVLSPQDLEKDFAARIAAEDNDLPSASA